jgi:hypothetical protein
MALKAEYDKIDEVPEVHRELYTERDGKYVFTGLEGYDPGESKRLKTEAGGYRIKAREATERLTAYSRLSHPVEGKPFEKVEDLQAILDEYPTLKAQAEAGGGKSREAVAAQVEIEKKRLEAQYARQITEKDTLAQKAASRVTHYEDMERRQAIREAVLKAIGESKIGKFQPDAIEDALMYADRHLEVDEERDEEGNLVIKDIRTRDKVGVTPGLQPAAWLAEMQPKKGHWYLASEGGGSLGTGRGGAGSGGAGNPFSASGWNMTAQGAYVREHGMEKAQQLARAAGTVLGGPPPAGAPNQPVTQQRSRGR